MVSPENFESSGSTFSLLVLIFEELHQYGCRPIWAARLWHLGAQLSAQVEIRNLLTIDPETYAGS
jgi:hypothetical protein